PRRSMVHSAAHGEGRGRIRRDVEGARRLEPDDAGYWEVHVPPDLWAADAGVGEAARRLRLSKDRSQSARRPPIEALLLTHRVGRSNRTISDTSRARS